MLSKAEQKEINSYDVSANNGCFTGFKGQIQES